MTSGATATRRIYPSVDYLLAAALFARACQGIETTLSGGADRATQERHRAYVLGAIQGTVALLKATVNEIYADADAGYLRQQQDQAFRHLGNPDASHLLSS